MNKLIEEFLKNGGAIEKVPTVENTEVKVISPLSKRTPELKTLEEAELLYGKNHIKKRTKKNKDIDMSLIPDHLKELLSLKEKPL